MPRRPWDDVIGEDERLVQLSYRSPRRFRERRALILIDLYNRAFGDERLPLAEAVRREPSSCGEVAWDALPAIQRYLALARQHDVPVIYTVSDERTHGVGSATLRAVHGFDQGDSHPAPWGNTIVEPLRPRSDEPVFEKARASGFFGTSLLAHLRQLGVDAIVIVGESTSGCVRASAVDAYSNGFDVAIPEDGVFDRSPLSHRMSLYDLNCKYGTVVTPTTAAELLSAGGHRVLDADGEIADRTP